MRLQFFQKKDVKGFTLIELMVVISIIGLLSTIVLAALGSARSKGTNGRIQSDVISMKNAIEIGLSGFSYTNLLGSHYVPSGGGYYVAVDTFFNSNMTSIENDILTANKGLYGGGTSAQGTSCSLPYYNMEGNPLQSNTTNAGLVIYTNNSCAASNLPNATSYAIYAAYAPLGTGGYFCLDSAGNSKSVTTGVIPAISTASNPVCQ